MFKVAGICILVPPIMCDGWEVKAPSRLFRNKGKRFDYFCNDKVTLRLRGAEIQNIE